MYGKKTTLATAAVAALAASSLAVADNDDDADNGATADGDSHNRTPVMSAWQGSLAAKDNNDDNLSHPTQAA